MTELLNYSEFATLTQCERKWAYAYGLEREEPGEKRGLNLGTLCHQWYASWLLGEGGVLSDTWVDDIEQGGKPGEPAHYQLSDFDPELVARSLWLRDRFIECYGPQPPSSWTVIAAEQWMTRQFDGFTLVGRCDGIVRIDGHLWLIELKTYGSRPGPLTYAQVSPQLGCYGLLTQEHYGEPVWGVIYQGIYTYRWKPTVPTQASIIEEAIADGVMVDGVYSVENMSKVNQKAWAKSVQANHPGIERPAAESFDQIEVELGDEHYNTAVRYLGNAVRRRNVLNGTTYDVGFRPTSPLDFALPNIGSGCGWCGFREECWAALGGVEPFEIEVTEDDGEDAVPR